MSLDFSQQFGDFIVFDGNYLLEAVELNAEDFSLVLQVLLHIFQLEVDHLFEFFLELGDLLVLIIDSQGSALLLVLYHTA